VLFAFVVLPPQPFYGPFSGTTRVSRVTILWPFFRDHPGEPGCLILFCCLTFNLFSFEPRD